MSSLTGWALAAAAAVLGWTQYGWRGLSIAVTAIVFWLLLQFSRAVRAMKDAGSAPVGHVDSALMLNVKLKPGMTLLQIIGLTKSLGQRVGEAGVEPERWRWVDAGGVSVTLALQHGKLVSWELQRPAE